MFQGDHRMTHDTGTCSGFFSQPSAVWAVAFAVVVSFTGLGTNESARTDSA
jgi:hypothetical protein